MVLLSVDVGKHTGWCVSDNGKVKATGHFTWKEFVEFGFECFRLMDAYTPDRIITAIPTWRYMVVKAQSKLIGILEYAASNHAIPVTEVTDSRCKYALFGKSQVTKDEIMARYASDNEHVADSQMFAEFYFKKNGKNTDQGTTRKKGTRARHVAKRRKVP